jgi:hypothetical protein
MRDTGAVAAGSLSANTGKTISSTGEQRRSNRRPEPNFRWSVSSQGKYEGNTTMKIIADLLVIGALIVSSTAQAQSPNDPAVDACRSSGLVALKQVSRPSVRNLVFDMETVLFSKANTRVEDVPIRTVMTGEAYIDKNGFGKSQRFVCLIGDKGKVLLTFFMEQ